MAKKENQFVQEITRAAALSASEAASLFAVAGASGFPQYPYLNIVDYSITYRLCQSIQL